MDRAAAKEIRSQARAILRDADNLLARREQLVLQVRKARDTYLTVLIEKHMQHPDLGLLKPYCQVRVAWKALDTAGYRTPRQVLNANVRALMSTRGVGAQSAHTVKLAAERYLAELHRQTQPKLDPLNKTQESTALLVAIMQLHDFDAAMGTSLTAATRARASLLPLLSASKWAVSILGPLFSRKRKLAAEVDVAELHEQIQNPIYESLAGALARAQTAGDIPDAWFRFEQDSSRYLAQLDDATSGAIELSPDLDPSILERINAISLDTEALQIPLRKYQAFGAKFTLAQQRVLLGDDMGLGKTVQALAVISHRYATGATKFLVICPASLLVNWEREVQSKTTLSAHVLHSTRSSDSLNIWLDTGGVAITTYDQARRLSDGDLHNVDVLVVDEAHFAKNPSTQRTQNVMRAISASQYVLLMSGTPLENRPEEFVRLVGLVNREVSLELQSMVAVSDAKGFRKAAAPVYLRRRASDVLTELPPVISTNSWEIMSSQDLDHYHQAVLEANFMGMRRAGMQAVASGSSAKYERLLELLDEAQQTDQRVLIFSYFLDVLDDLKKWLPGSVFGPINGSVPPAQRQQMIDDFSAAPGGAVLVAQVQSGGTGLNIQAASIVILTEPQVKPSIEAQAVARAARMGQLRSVNVYRLLNPDSVDERMLQILGTKSLDFDRYVNDSETATISTDATEASLAATIVAEEQARLGVTQSSRNAT